MRLRLVAFSVLVALVSALSASGALGATTKTVNITAGGFSPKTASITADDSIVWKNTDSKNHQIVSTRGSFASPVIAPGKTYTFTFAEAGNYDYRDALHPRLTGTIRVAGLPPALTLGVNAPQINTAPASCCPGRSTARSLARR